MKNWNDFPIHPAKMEHLSAAFNLVQSDKSQYHHYERIYQHFLPDSISIMLEIGLGVTAHHNSILAWPHIFPLAKIYGADRGADRMVTAPGIKTFLVDQDSDIDLKQFAHSLNGLTFDLIIDDASHIFENTRRTFEWLAPKLKSGGVYFIEDITTRTNILTESGRPEQSVQQIETWLQARGEDFDLVQSLPENPAVIDSVIACIRK
jgi:alkanesulfonate monooxygenase SsuD/methylene tetrahydromethanopterin reductase-like flavin-dependent oxidoreductase (luciferase family)